MKNLLKSILLSSMLFMTNITAATNSQDVENFVSRFYTEVLNRTPDTEGLNNWVNRLIQGESSGADVATGFIFSSEFIEKNTSNTTFLNILYKAFFNRAVDTDGFNTWLSKLNQGTSREDVLNGFLYSVEFFNLAEKYGIKAVSDNDVEKFVKRFYSVVLGREADTAGLADWVNRLNTKVATGADIANGFIFSTEFDEASKNDINFLNTLYLAFFNRIADDDGLNIWISELEQGVSRKVVLDGFLYSTEFKNLCDSYGILAYKSITSNVESDFVCMQNSLKDLKLDFNPGTATLDDEIKVIDAYNQWAISGEGRSWSFEKPYSCYQTYLIGIGGVHVCTYAIKYTDLICGISGGHSFLY